MEDPRIISALFIFLKMAYYNVLINTLSLSFPEMVPVPGMPDKSSPHPAALTKRPIPKVPYFFSCRFAAITSPPASTRRRTPPATYQMVASYSPVWGAVCSAGLGVCFGSTLMS